MIKTSFSAFLRKPGRTGLSLTGDTGYWFSRRIWLDDEKAGAGIYVKLDGALRRVEDLRADGWEIQLPEAV